MTNQRSKSSYDISGVASAGTYGFCAPCHKQANCCCLRVRRGGDIDPPLLFDQGTVRIEVATGMDRRLFSRAYPSPERIRVIKSGPSGCFFWVRGRCQIYDVRPVDCRLFPLDIIEKDGRLVWIAYTSVCPVKFDLQDCLRNGRVLAELLGDNIFQYARFRSPSLDRQEYVELAYVWD